MHKIITVSGIFFFFSLSLFGQAVLPDKEALTLHSDRRDALRHALPPNSVAVFFANPIRNRANDVDYVYHQDPNLFYLTGWKEPHAVLLVFSTPQMDEQGAYSEKIFVQERDPRAEIWNGYRLGKAGALQMGFDRVALREEFVQSPVDFDRFDQVFMFDFHDDERKHPGQKYDLYQLKKTFKQAIRFPEDFDRRTYQIQQSIRTVTADNLAAVYAQVKRQVQRDSTLLKDPLIEQFISQGGTQVPEDVKMKSAFLLRDYFFDVSLLPRIMGDLREVKTPFEKKRLKRAIEISAIGQVEVMKALRPGMSEREVQGIHEYVFKKYGAAYEGYPSIVGAGNNGCVLHYIDNATMPESDDLILMDLGAEYEGYTADVTRTLPVVGTFTAEQRLIYQIVFEAQEAGIEKAVVGSSATAVTKATQAVVSAGLLKLGIIEKEEDFRRYFPHGAAHHIGLDVHDLSNYGPLPEDAIITVEPGIYIPKGSPCDPKWWGIGIRIEDDILITKSGPVNLSAAAPREWKAIEEMMALPSALDDFQLPKLSN